jgi:amidase
MRIFDDGIKLINTWPIEIHESSTSIYLHPPTTMSTTWQEIAAEKKARQAASIPKEWLIAPPSDDVLDVTDIPAKCGLLSARDLEITEVSSVAVILNKIATGAWSSVEVTTAFCKRAVIAHQVVRDCL